MSTGCYDFYALTIYQESRKRVELQVRETRLHGGPSLFIVRVDYYAAV